jgi:hypothetical protein
MTKESLAAIADQLRKATSLDEANRIAAGLRGQTLQAVIDYLAITTPRDVDRKRRYLVEATAGRRLDGDAITRVGRQR